MRKFHDPEDAPKIMSMQLLSEITNNFSEERKLGSGTYGEVFKGVQNGEEVAVKMLRQMPGLFDDLEQFKKEFENLKRLRHENIVQLLGYCYETKHEYVVLGDGRGVFAQNTYRALCFEYMHNGSLQKHLYDEYHGLDWQTRYNIIKGICKGLKYLHEGFESPIYHLDLKPENILLDKAMVPKLADFGLSKLVHNDQTQATWSSIGTIGYLPPEYIEENLVSKKLDIFSLGVVMIRIITGYGGYHKKAEMSSEEFIDLVHNNWRNRLQVTPGCTLLEDECHQVKRCTEIALDCVKADRKQRPDIGAIINWLNETEDMNKKFAMSLPYEMRHGTVSCVNKIEWPNNRLEVQSDSNVALIDELDKLLQFLQIPPEYEASLTGGSFDEGNMVKNIEACEWLTSAIKNLEASNLDPVYVKLHAVREKRAEFVLLKCTFVRRASEFLRNYFPGLIDSMLNDKNNISQRGHLQRPDHAYMRYKCRTYARLLQYIKSWDKSCMTPLRKAYCHSLNLLIRRETREFSNELRASSKASKSSTPLFEGPPGANQRASITYSSADAYSKMITTFIPLFVDESSFFAHFMCFEVSALASSDASNSSPNAEASSTSASIVKPSNNPAELGVLNECLQELLDGVQEDFYALVDWAFKLDPLSCISMHGITDRYLSGQKAEVAGYVHVLLDDLETRITILFSRFVDDACYQIEKYERNVRQIGVVPYIPRFSQLAARMEQYINGSRDLLDQAYTKIVSIMFVVLEKIAQVEPEYVDIVLLENYAAFQHSLYDLANVVPTLAKYYHQASEAYEQACSRHINLVICIHFEKLFQFAQKIEELMYNMSPEEIPFQVGMSKVEFRKMLKSSLSGLDKTINAMYRKLQKNITAEELLPSLWEKCKKEFLDKYATFLKLISKVYPDEKVTSAIEMRDILASL